MKMNDSLFKLTAVGMLAAGLLLICGCEDGIEGPDTSELVSYFDNNPYEELERENISTVALVIAPRVATVTYDGALQKLKASGGKPPYSWSVSDVSLGSIVERSGENAVYQRDRTGDNIVILTDANRDETYCLVKQPEEE